MPSIDRPPTEVGCPIPANTPHAVSVTLPSWKANVAYEEGQDWVVSKMKSGYPRFFYHEKIRELFEIVEAKFGQPGEKSIIFPSYKVACKCRDFILAKTTTVPTPNVRVVEVTVPPPSAEVQANVYVIFYTGSDAEAALAKAFWQHTGDGISSRQAEYVGDRLKSAQTTKSEPKPVEVFKAAKTFKRYARRLGVLSPASVPSSEDESDGSREFSTYVEERFGRNLDISFIKEAKIAIRRRIAGTMDDNLDLSQILASSPQLSTRNIEGLGEDDVFLYPTGMSSIFNAHQLLLSCFEPRESICFGFPYIDTLKILNKWGPGCFFYGNGEPEDLVEIEKFLQAGNQILGFFCEFPSNPLLKSPNLKEIRRLADKYDFLVVVDETVGNFLNIHVLEYADIAVSSLTKVFSGDSNVMAGSLVLSPVSKYYNKLKTYLAEEYEDNFWAEDAIFLERNSRDVASRIHRINNNAEALSDLLSKQPKVKQVFYPKLSPTRSFYDQCKTEQGGYGGLISIVFHNPESSKAFFDAVGTAKGPSLGTNFTLLCPYTVLAHYTEQEWAAQYGVDAHLVRISVGLEPTEELVGTFAKALESC
ncbi:pyridoxal phosphate-dependent transferase [Lipomyces japonicus]|uniref:pyridoxal phosphate-dependent transferase n=1 Tax=Lipomyces japonicus TaxID=56871 RepID=UPI0034CDB51D